MSSAPAWLPLIWLRAAVTAICGTLVLGGCAATPPAAPDASSPPRTGDVIDQVDAYWDYVSSRVPTAERPDVDRVRFVDPIEWPTVQAECMHAAGFPDTAVSPDGGLSPGALAPGQEDAYLLARYVCVAQHPIDPKYSVPLTEQQIQAVYRYYVDDLIPCLEREGYTVPAPPSVEVFIETFGTSQWMPYAKVFGTDPSIPISEYYRVSAACPQWPSDLYD